MCSLRVDFFLSYYKLNQKDMKYFVIAALLATAQAADKPAGCQAGIKAKIYKDKDCAQNSHATVQAFQKDVENTGKCISAEATKEDKAAVETAKKDLDAAKAVTAEKAKALADAPKMKVKDDKEETVPKALGDKYTELKKAHYADEAATAAYKKVIADLKKDEDDALVVAKKDAYTPYYVLK